MSNDNETDQSGLRFYGIGVVAIDKPRGSDNIMVSPVEKVPMNNGRVKDTEEVMEYESTGIGGVKKSDKVTAQAMIQAKWFPLSEGNRQTAPDVQEGESVRLWRYGNSNEYYWTTMYREPGIRRLETVLYCYGNLSTKGKGWDKDSSYWHEVSTHDKHMRWQTTQSDGEQFAYNFHISPKDSTVTLEDNIGNQWFMDSNAVLMRCKNSDGSFIDIEKLRYHSFAKEHMEHQSDITHMHTPLFTVTANDEGGYRGGAFVQIDFNSNHAQIGSGEGAYSHYKGGDIVTKSDSSIDETTSNKSVRNDTSYTQSSSVTEEYGMVSRSASHISESVGTVSRSASSSTDTTGSREIKSDTSNETIGAKTETVSDLKQDVAKADSKIDDYKLESQKQELTVAKRDEKIESLKSDIGTREQNLGESITKVSGNETREVGSYDLKSGGDVNVNSGGKIRQSDTEISNLDVPGVITVAGRDVEKELDKLYAITAELAERLTAVEGRFDAIDQTLEKHTGEIAATSESVDSVKDSTDENTSEISKLDSNARKTEEELNTAKDKLRETEAVVTGLKQTIMELQKQLEEQLSVVTDLKGEITTVAAQTEEALVEAQNLKSTTEQLQETAEQTATDLQVVKSDVETGFETVNNTITVVKADLTVASRTATTALEVGKAAVEAAVAAAGSANEAKALTENLTGTVGELNDAVANIGSSVTELGDGLDSLASDVETNKDAASGTKPFVDGGAF